jgi:hypothetical protein
VDESAKYEYSYDITAKLVASESGAEGKLLYEDEEIILPSKTVSGQTGQDFAINEAVEVDYDKYNGLITAFRQDYGLTIESSVTYSLNVYVTAKHDNFAESLETIQAVALKIPLSERTINVSVDSDKLDNSGALEEKSHNLGKNWPYVVVAAAAGLIFIIDLILSLTIFWRREAHRTTYEKTLAHILHEYNQLIVEVERMPHAARDHVVEVASFDDLLDARDTIQQPILHLEIADDRSLFAIEDDGMIYAYALSAKALNKDKKEGRSAKKRAAKTDDPFDEKA